jgi:CHASE2 domain-containing sensor protein
VELFKLYFSPIHTPDRFKAIVVNSSAGEQEDESFLPFTDNGKDWRTTLIKVLELSAFNSKDFRQEGEQTWMVKAGLLTEDFQTFHPNLLKNIGEVLYQSLFPSGGRLENILKSALRSAENQNIYLHIQFTFQEDSVQRSRFADYPWELLHDGTRFLAHRRVTFSRYIAHESAPPNLPLTEKINVLLVSSNAFDAEQGLKKLSNHEQQAIFQGLQKAQTKGHIKLHQPKYSTVACLRAHLTEHQGTEAPHVVHFDGHGLFGKRCPNQACRTMHKGIKVEYCRVCDTLLPEAQGYLAFENEQSGADYVSAEEFGLLLQTASAGNHVASSHGITLAVLSACQSGMSVSGDSVFNGIAQNLISQRVPAVVAMQYSVLVESATQFAEQFYRSLGQKNSLALAVSQGREAMGLSTQQWFRPVLYLRWQDNVGGQLFQISSQERLRKLTWKGLTSVSGSITAILLIFRFLGAFQSLELKTYDHFMRYRLINEGSDPRLLIVQVTDNDLTEQVKRNEQGQGTLKEATVNQLLQKLEKLQPRLIGFDLYRDFKAADSELGLAPQLKNNRFFAGCKVPETEEEGKEKRAGISSPPEVPLERVGFSDFVEDQDQVLRRYLIAQDTMTNSQCTTKESFSLVLARRYLELENASKFTYQAPFPSGELLKIGDFALPHIQPFTGGYQDIDSSGYQLLLNYRAVGANPEAIAKLVTVEDVLNNRVSGQDVRDKIVVIGITAKVAISDDWNTPYGTLSGVILQAHMISQVLSTAQNKRSLITVFPQWVEYLWILGWSAIGAYLIYQFRISWKKVGISAMGGLLVLYAISLSSFSWFSLWLPFLPSVLTFFTSGGVVLCIVYRPINQPLFSIPPSIAK